VVSADDLGLEYRENGETLFQLTAPVMGCSASLGVFPHWCLGNIDNCGTQGFSLGFWLQLQPSDVTSPDVIMLTNGGSTPNSKGFYVARRYGDQVEVGVANGGNLWTQTVRMRADDVPAHVTVTWNAKDGLVVGIDGVTKSARVLPTSRVDRSSTVAHAFRVGLDVFGQPLTSPCTFSVSGVVMTNSVSDALNFTQAPGQWEVTF
jgi:hypothetical protein